jgi:hypothetical protein
VLSSFSDKTGASFALALMLSISVASVLILSNVTQEDEMKNK